MALSPSIPTSFVPKQPAPQNQRRMSSGNNIFLMVSLAVFVFALFVSGGTFLYATYLKSVENTKGAQLVQAQKNVDPNTVQDLIRLQNRLTVSKGLINKHVELSQFFTLLEGATLTDVRFTGLDIIVADDRSATLTMNGQAKNFNALASESKVFATQKYIKSAIFSNIAINKDNTITFAITATLDPAVVTEAAPPAGSTPAATASTSVTSIQQTALPTLPPATTGSAATSSKAATTTP